MEKNFQELQSSLSEISHDIIRGGSGMFSFFGGCVPAMGIIAAQKPAGIIKAFSDSLSGQEKLAEEFKFNALQGCCFYVWYQQASWLSTVKENHLIEALKHKLEIQSLREVDTKEYKACLEAFGEYVASLSADTSNGKSYPVNLLDADIQQQLKDQFATSQQSTAEKFYETVFSVGDSVRSWFS